MVTILFLVSNAKLPKICMINEKLRCFYVFLANRGEFFTTTETTQTTLMQLQSVINHDNGDNNSGRCAQMFISCLSP